MRTLFVFTSPFAVTIWILLLGVALLWWPRWLRCGRWFVTIGMLSLALQSMTTLGGSLLGRIEFREKILDDGSPDLPMQVVVLGGGVQPSKSLPLVSQLSPTSLERLVEGVRLHHLNPERKLLLSGGGGEAEPEAGETVVPGEGLLAIPGLVNAHYHSPDTLIRGSAPMLPL
jgi:uncharacterized SAM-binding protein YcdF (DUF218 family)